MNKQIDLGPSWNTFMIAILYKKQITPEQAQELWVNGFITKNRNNKELDDEIANFKRAGMTYEDIGMMVGLGTHAVYHRLRKSHPEMIGRKNSNKTNNDINAFMG